MTSNARARERTAVEEYRPVCLRTRDGGLVRAIVRDESEGGLGVEVQQRTPGMVRGSTIRVTWEGGESDALIAHVTEHNCGTWLVGLEWLIDAEV